MFVDLAIASSIAAAVILRCLREDLHADRRLIAAFNCHKYFTVRPCKFRMQSNNCETGSPARCVPPRAKFHEDLDFMANYPGEAFLRFSDALLPKAGAVNFS